MDTDRQKAIAQLNRWYARLFKRVGWGWDMPTLACCEPGVYNSLRRLKDIARPYREEK